MTPEDRPAPDRDTPAAGAASSRDSRGAPRVDVARTRAARATFTRGGAEACGCASCRRWLDARDEAWPDGLDAWLAERGMADGFESAVDEVADEDGGGWDLVFHALPEGGTADLEEAGDPAEPDPGLPDPGPLPGGVAAATWRAADDRAPAGWPEGGLELTLRLQA